MILKQLENLSDESVVLQWKRNPYYQAFCGMNEFKQKLPCHSTELVHFRKRIGAEGVERIFRMSVCLHGESALEDVVHVDTTVHEKNITYPTGCTRLNENVGVPGVIPTYRAMTVNVLLHRAYSEIQRSDMRCQVRIPV